MAITQADLGDLLAHISQKKLPTARSDYRLMVSEVVAGRVLACHQGRAGTAPPALGGIFVPDNGGPATCWFSVLPGALARSLAPFVLQLRDVLRHTAPQLPAGLAAFVRDDNPEGARLARVLGFQPTDATIAGTRQWRLEGERRTDRQNCEAAVPTCGAGTG